MINNFTFRNYKEFCNDFKLKECNFKNLKIFKIYCEGNYEVLFSLI